MDWFPLDKVKKTASKRKQGAAADDLKAGIRSLVDSFFSRQFLFFVFFGGTAAVVNVGGGYLLYNEKYGLGWPYCISITLSAIIGIAVNFSLNYFFNFTYRGRSAAAMFQTFFVVAMIGILLTTVLSVTLLYLFDNIWLQNVGLPGQPSNKFTANLTAVGLTTIYSYIAHRTISFNVGFMARLSSIKKLQNLFCRH